MSNKALKRLSSPLSCEEGLLACKLRNVGLTYIIKLLRILIIIIFLLRKINRVKGVQGYEGC